ncbi:MAG TPA: Glu/Leu/Phe/Val dehydrogenase dimerization domain-containing protein [Patescibacteria group bacterium]|nr:Glu/Leu/Phe/Val dehydrogenase dimerization domain-containing protein [Patescibacteria group bacterium]
MSRTVKLPQVFPVTDDACGLQGWLAVDSLINNRCCGGLRIRQGIDAQEMAGLAEAMTLKFGFLGLPHGGAKAGISCDDEAPKEKKVFLLQKFLKKAQAILGEVVYEPYPDVGTDRDCITAALKTLGRPVPARALVTERGGWYTSLTVIACAKAGAQFARMDLAGATVAVEGFGSVGSAVAENLYRLGSRVVAVSTSRGTLFAKEGLDIPALLKLRQELGSRIVERSADFRAQRLEPGALVELDVDALFPCAIGSSIHKGNVSRIRAGLISPGANLPLTTEAEDILFQKGVICIPHFIANCGGILGGTMEFAGFRPQEIDRDIGTVFFAQVSDLIRDTFGAGKRPLAALQEVALERFGRVKASSEKKSLRGMLFLSGMSLYRNGLLPRPLVKSASAEYFTKRMQGRF